MAYIHKWQNIGYAYPHNTENIRKAIHWAQLAAQENQNTITILTIPDEDRTTNDTPYKTKFDDTHVNIYFPPDTITYKEPTIPPELNKEPRKKTLTIRILCIHHQTTKINIVDLETKLLQITTNLTVNPPYIKAPPPTPLNIKVYKHPKWNKTPYPINRSQNTSPQLPNFPQNQHQKFPPQYCYYTDGSFLPPKKLSENIWETCKSWIWHLERTPQNKYIKKTNRTTKHTPSGNISHIPYTSYSQPRIPSRTSTYLYR
jgi:hypothetical protein